jgi:hypothetical protein
MKRRRIGNCNKFAGLAANNPVLAMSKREDFHMAQLTKWGRGLAIFGLGGALVLSLGAATEDDPKTIQAAQQSLDAEIQPTAGLIFNALGDANDIQVLQGGAVGEFWLDPSLPLRLQAMWGDFSQDQGKGSGSNDFERTAFHLFMNEYRLQPQLWVSGRLTGEFFDEDELLGGQLGAHFQQEDRSLWSLEAASESFWTIYDVQNPRQYPRVNNLELVDQDARINRIWGTADLVPVAEQQLRLQVGGSDYEQDNNEQIFAYAHYQFPVLDSEAGKWTVLRPNIYFEHFSDSSPAYFSPDSFIALGLAGHTIRKDPLNRLEFEVNPVLLFENGDMTSNSESVEMGLHVVLDYTRKIGRHWALGAGGFLYGETTEYWIWRTTAQCSYKF